ncbi:MAG: indolepyruvate oxidoreductase subunit beta [Fibrobacter sp.]|nr:indolepyruvate oxidoreductase subunit beta [Fibrobacter sp.]
MNNPTIYNILFCGTGGQGVLKASEVCGVAAVNAGFRVKKSEVHGMAQRGGSVESHLRFGQNLYSPLICPGEADFLVAFHDGEAARNRFYLKSDGTDLSKFLHNAEELKDSRYTNTFFLGILASQLPIAEHFWYEAIKTVVGKKIEENIEVFKSGLQLGKDQIR